MSATRVFIQQESPKSPERPWPMGPAVGSIIIFIAWLVFILVYALYWSSGYDLFQNIIVTIVSLAISCLVVGLMWMVWGSRRHWMFDDYGWRMGPK